MTGEMRKYIREQRSEILRERHRREARLNDRSGQSKLSPVEILTLAQTGLKMGLNRAQAFEAVKGKVGRNKFYEAWKMARQMEKVFPSWWIKN